MIAAPDGLTFTQKVHFTRSCHGQKQMAPGNAPAPPSIPLGHVPRISRLMALAIRFEGLIERGEVRDYAQLARLGHVTRARVTQIVNLLNLAPDIQESILFLPPIASGHDPIKEWQVRPISAMADWAKQRRAWYRLAFSATRAG